MGFLRIEGTHHDDAGDADHPDCNQTWKAFDHTRNLCTDAPS